MKSGNGIDRLAVAQTQLGGISACPVTHGRWERDGTLPLSMSTQLFSVWQVFLGRPVCANHCSVSRDYVVGDPQECCRDYSQTILLENNKKIHVF